MLIRWMKDSDMEALFEVIGEQKDKKIKLKIKRQEINQQLIDQQDTNHTEINQHEINQHISRNEALVAVDYQSGTHLGFLFFNREHKLIENIFYPNDIINPIAEERLRKVAFRQLHIGDEVIKSGSSFHYNYPSFIKASKEENCPVCQGKPAPKGQQIIIETPSTFTYGEYPGQARLFGKLYIMPKKHYFHFEDMPAEEMTLFMGDVQKIGRVLRKVTGAEKINYEMHANSGAHLHIHLFPRYLDDDFPSQPIDYRIKEPAPYESMEEFNWFIMQMRILYNEES